jgi:GlpG protein
MRRIGQIADEKLARRFCDYLITLSIDAATEGIGESSDERGPAHASGNGWDIWVRDEAHVERARQELDAFKQSPEDPRYQAEREAAQIREDRIKRERERQKNQIDRSKWARSTGAAGTALAGAPVRQTGIPVTIGIILVSVICSFTTNFGRPRVSPDPNKQTLEASVFFALSFVDYREYEKAGDPLASIRRGEIWRFVTPMFLHGDTLHLAFNMLWIYFLGSAIERLHGSLFFIVLVLVTQWAGMMLQVLMPEAESLPPLLVRLAGSPFAIGASGAVYGLLGFLLIRPMLDPAYPIHLVPMNVALMLGWLVFCMLPVMDLRVANGAHLGGLVAGGVVAMVLPRTTFRPGG